VWEEMNLANFWAIGNSLDSRTKPDRMGVWHVTKVFPVWKSELLLG